ncbi:MAG TPA: universal stress protein [Vicinamibacteria bacterium]
MTILQIRRVLLPTDLSESADRALQQAVELAAQHRATLDIFHVATLEHVDPAEIQPAFDAFLARVEKEVFEDLAARSEPIRTRGIAVETAVVRQPYPVEGILERIRQTHPDLVVMGTHGRTGLRKLLLGSVAARIVLEAPCPVMTVAADAEVAEGETGFDPILVPVDFNELAGPSIEAAKALSAGRLILVHVVSIPEHPSVYAGGFTRVFQQHPELSTVIGNRLSELYGGPGEIVVSEGNVVDEILEAAKSKRARLVVMGTRGLDRKDYLRLGSVTERVIGRAKIPVLAVK